MTANAKQQRFLELYEPVHDRFERFCRARVFGKMEYTDLMNDTLLVAFEKMDQLESPAAFLSFLIGISVRILANQQRKKKEQPAWQAEGVDPADHSANTARDAEVYLLQRALAHLPDDQRESLILFEISGFSIKEIAALQRASISAVKQRIRRGRARLAEIISFEAEHKTLKHGN